MKRCQTRSTAFNLKGDIALLATFVVVCLCSMALLTLVTAAAGASWDRLRRRNNRGSDKRELAIFGEAGYAHAGQPKRSRPVAEAAVEERAGELRDLFRIVDRNPERDGAAPNREVRVAELELNRPGRKLLFTEPAAHHLA